MFVYTNINATLIDVQKLAELRQKTYITSTGCASNGRELQLNIG